MDTYTETRFPELLSQLRASTTLHYREQLAARVASLAPCEDEPNDVALSTSSLQSLIQFLTAHPNLKYPTVTITPSGDFYASWRKNRDCVFSIEFLGNGKVRFVVLRLESNEQLSGLTTDQALMELVAPLNVMEWAGQ